MPENSDRASREPRVFISYARSDGESVAQNLRLRLEKEKIPLWQDRVGMEGGRDWWLQIAEALNHVEFMVLLMTPAALQSSMVRKEWRYARQQGICVYPVKAAANLNFSALPHWMRDVHWYDLEHEWPKLVNDLNTRCQKTRVPFMVEDLPPEYVPRDKEFEELISNLLDDKREEPVAITAALRGTGGYGKTTMAKALCHDERIQQAFDDGVLWVTLGENPGNLIGRVEDFIYILSHERPGFTGLEAATTYFAELLADRDILLVIDDVWNPAHLKPFLRGGKRCARLITTRNEDVLPDNAQQIVVDAMLSEEAVQLLLAGLDHLPLSNSEKNNLRPLAARLGEWPLLLTLVNGALSERINRGQSFTNALSSISKTLDKRGLTAFDAQNTLERNRAVMKTLGVSFDVLSANDYARYKELALFPEDIDIPLATVQRLWEETAGLDEVDTEELCERLYKLSLLLRFDLATRTIRLHDIMRTILQQQVGAKDVVLLHQQLLDSYGLKGWADLPHDEPYLWQHLAEHLIGAGRIEELVLTVKDGFYLAAKTVACSISDVETDLSTAEHFAPDDTLLQLLKRSIVPISYLLNQCKTVEEALSVLYYHLTQEKDLADAYKVLAQKLTRPFFAPGRIVTNRSDKALLRVLQGHNYPLMGCAVSPIGDFIVSASFDQTLKVWDAHSGRERLTLTGHTAAVTGCAVSPTGDFIVSASSDQTLKVWNAHTGTERFTLSGHTDKVNGCAVSSTGDFIVSASEDETLKVWDAHSGRERFTLTGHTAAVTGCAVSPIGDFIVSASFDGTLMVWDAHSGTERFTISKNAGTVLGCAISPAGDFIVSASFDGTLMVWDIQKRQEQLILSGTTSIVMGCAVNPSGDLIVFTNSNFASINVLKVWDAHTGTERFTLSGHTDMMRGCAISPTGDFIVSASHDETLMVWDAHTGIERFTLSGHTAAVMGCAISPVGDYIVSASHDETLKVWDAHTGTERFTLSGHTNGVMGCAISPAGDFIVSASLDRTLKVWDAHFGTERFTLSGHSAEVMGCAVSPTGKTIISVSWDKSIKLWDVQTQRTLSTLYLANTLMCCNFFPDGEQIVVGGFSGIYFLQIIQ